MNISAQRHASINFAFMRIGKRLEQAIAEFGTKAEFARRMNVDSQSVRNWVNRGLPAELSFEAGRILGKNPEWFVNPDPKIPEHVSEQATAETVEWRRLSPARRELLQRLLIELAK